MSKCSTGKPCGETCIAKADKCTNAVPSSAGELLTRVASGRGMKLIGEGNYGAVYKSDEGTIVKLSKEPGKGIGANEAALQTEAHKLGIAPKVHEATENMLAIEGWMPEQGWRAGKNYKPIKGINDAERESVTNQLQTLHANGIASNDLHSGNIFINRKLGRTGIIDYGLAKEKTEEGFISAVIADLGKGSSAIGGFSENSIAKKARDELSQHKSSTKAGKLARFAIAQAYLLALEKAKAQQ